MIRKLVVVANVQWPKFGAVAGGTVHTFEVARRLKERCDVLVVAPDFLKQDVEATYPEIELALTPSLRRMTTATFPSLAFSCFSWFYQIRSLRRADAILCASHLMGDVLPLLFVPSVPTAVIVHHLVEPPWRRPGSPLLNWVHYLASRASLAIATRRAHSIITLSELVARELRSSGVRLPVVVTTNAPTPFSAVPPSAESRSNERVVFVGHVAPPKGIESLLRAWPHIVSRRPAASLRIIGAGDPAFVASLVERVEALGISDSVVFLGRVDEAEKQRELFQASVFAFPSLEEGFGIALVEAMAARIPCVTYDLPIFRELFTRGRVAVPNGDVDRFADAVVELLENESRRTTMADDAHESSRRFNWDRAADLDWYALELAAR